VLKGLAEKGVDETTEMIVETDEVETTGTMDEFCAMDK